MEKAEAGILIGILSYLVGGFDTLAQALGILMICDYLTGIAVAMKKGTLNSRRGIMGFVKKLVMILGLVVCVQLDHVTGQQLFRNMFASYFTFNEALSIVENSAKLGINYPVRIKELFEQLSKGEETKHDA